MAKVPLPSEINKKSGNNTKTPQKLRLQKLLSSNLCGFIGLQDPNFHSNHKSCVMKRTNAHINILCQHPHRDRGPTANSSGEVIKMSIQTSIVIKNIKSKYKVTSSRVVCIPHKLQVSSDPRAEGVPNNNQRGRGSGPFRL